MIMINTNFNFELKNGQRLAGKDNQQSKNQSPATSLETSSQSPTEWQAPE
jgi:hypothetical protein